MKLYTEEQVLKMLEVCRDTDLYEHILTFEDIVKTETPIKLPSDEEIDAHVDDDFLNATEVHKYSEEAQSSVIVLLLMKAMCKAGAKWMRDKIGGNK